MKRLAVLFLLSACAAPETEPPIEACGRLQSHPNLDCAHYPELCAGATGHDVNEPNLSLAIDVAFIGDGFDASEMARFRAKVRRIIADASHDEKGIVGRDPALFNFHWIELASPDHGRVEDEPRHDTPLGACLQPDKYGSKPPRIVVDDRVALFVATENLLDVDVVVVVVDGERGRANATIGNGSVGMIRMGRHHDDRVFTHELGHALVGLEDEYVEETGCYAAPAIPFFSTHDDPLFAIPNLSLDAYGGKWKSLVEGAEEGGAGFASCVHHPTSTCRMIDAQEDRFCPVCADAIERTLAAKRSNDGPPLCIVSLGMDPRDLTYITEAWVDARDLDGIASWRLRFEGTTLAAGSPHSRYWLAEGAGWLITYGKTDGPYVLEAECVDLEGWTTITRVDVVVDNKPDPPFEHASSM